MFCFYIEQCTADSSGVMRDQAETIAVVKEIAMLDTEAAKKRRRTETGIRETPSPTHSGLYQISIFTGPKKGRWSGECVKRRGITQVWSANGGSP